MHSRCANSSRRPTGPSATTCAAPARPARAAAAPRSARPRLVSLTAIAARSSLIGSPAAVAAGVGATSRHLCRCHPAVVGSSDANSRAATQWPDAVLPARHASKQPDLDGSHPLIVFDGVCVLCSGFARTVVRLDRETRFRFATAQSPLGEALYRKSRPADRRLRNQSRHHRRRRLHADGKPRRSDRRARLAVAGGENAPHALPQPLRDWLYGRIAETATRCSAGRTVAKSRPAELRARIIG